MDNNVTAAQIKSTSVSSDNIYVNGEELSSYINSHFQSGVQVLSTLNEGDVVANIKTETSENIIKVPSVSNKVDKEYWTETVSRLFGSPKSVKNGVLPLGTYDNTGFYYYDNGKICKSNITSGKFASLIRVNDSTIGFDGFLAIEYNYSDTTPLYKSTDGKNWELVRTFKATWNTVAIYWDKTNHTLIVNPAYSASEQTSPGEDVIFYFTKNLSDWTEYKDSTFIYNVSGSSGIAEMCEFNGKIFCFMSYSGGLIKVLNYQDDSYKFESEYRLPYIDYYHSETYGYISNTTIEHIAQMYADENGIYISPSVEGRGQTPTFYGCAGIWYSATGSDSSSWSYKLYCDLTPGSERYSSTRDIPRCVNAEGDFIYITTYYGNIWKFSRTSQTFEKIVSLEKFSGWSAVQIEGMTKVDDYFMLTVRGKYNGTNSGAVYKMDSDTAIEPLAIQVVNQKLLVKTDYSDKLLAISKLDASTATVANIIEALR